MMLVRLLPKVIDHVTDHTGVMICVCLFVELTGLDFLDSLQAMDKPATGDDEFMNFSHKNLDALKELTLSDARAFSPKK